MPPGLRIPAGDTLTAGRIELDAPINPHAGGDSVQILTEALRGVNRDTLISALAQLSSANEVGKSKSTPAAASAGGGEGGDAVTPKLVKRLAMLALVALTLLEPITSQISERLLSPRTELGDKIDIVLHEQAVLQATILSLAKWVVDVEQARERGASMPDPPAPVRLILAQDDVARSTGP